MQATVYHFKYSATDAGVLGIATRIEGLTGLAFDRPAGQRSGA
jgi:hypothetical protein